MTRTPLQTRWLDLTRHTLPALAPARGWPVKADHCFQRILLDHACGCCWYDHIAQRPAYRIHPVRVAATSTILHELWPAIVEEVFEVVEAFSRKRGDGFGVFIKAVEDAEA